MSVRGAWAVRLVSGLGTHDAPANVLLSFAFRQLASGVEERSCASPIAGALGLALAVASRYMLLIQDIEGAAPATHP